MTCGVKGFALEPDPNGICKKWPVQSRENLPVSRSHKQTSCGKEVTELSLKSACKNFEKSVSEHPADSSPAG